MAVPLRRFRKPPKRADQEAVKKWRMFQAGHSLRPSTGPDLHWSAMAQQPSSADEKAKLNSEALRLQSQLREIKNSARSLQERRRFRKDHRDGIHLRVRKRCAPEFVGKIDHHAC